MMKNDSWRYETKITISIILSYLTCMLLGGSSIAASNLPKFEVVGRDKTVLSIVVPQNTTSEQLKTLILQFRAARKSNSLSTMIPATTQGGKYGDYAIVWVFVLTERDWAAADKLRRFINSSAKSLADKEFDKKYVKHIKAEYFYSVGEEYGSLGYDDGVVRSSNYKKIF